jgi:hypothetical protein
VNAYLPPRPTIERCYAFGQAVAHTVTAMGLKTVVELVELTSALHALTHEPGREPNLSTTRPPMPASSDQRQAMIAMDLPAIAKMGGDLLVPFLANMQIERLRKVR